MLNKIIEWFRALWRDDIDPVIEQMAWDDYEYLRQKYGINQTYADEPEEGDSHWTE